MLTTRFEEALIFAFRLHANQVRKTNGVPYIAHLLSVAALVLEAGGDEDEAIAALLHDAVEDQGGYQTLSKIKERFGTRVAEIVDGCTDAYVTPKPPWKERKVTYLEHLRQSATKSVRLVSLADKLHNARSLYQDLELEGEDVWESFSGDKEGTLWYYRTLVEIFQEIVENTMTIEFAKIVRKIELAAEQTKEKGDLNMNSPLSLNNYQKLAERTSGAGGEGERRLMVSALGLAGEAGEFANLVKKMTAHGHPLDVEALADELGDVLWYLAEAASACGLDLGEIGEENVKKLRKRYPNGFSEERSLHRK